MFPFEKQSCIFCAFLVGLDLLCLLTCLTVFFFSETSCFHQELLVVLFCHGTLSLSRLFFDVLRKGV